MTKKICTYILCPYLLAVFLCSQVISQTIQTSAVQSMAGGQTEEGGFSIIATVGEAVTTGQTVSGSFTLSGGFIATLDYDNFPPSIVHTIVTTATGNQPLIITATITDMTGVHSGTLYYRKGGDASFTPVVMSVSENTIYTGTIPAADVSARGIEYYIIARDDLGSESREPASGFVSVRVSVVTVVKASAQPAGNAQNAYRLISLPLDVDNKSPASVFEGVLGAYDNTKWRLFELTADQTYREYPNTALMHPGNAFWLIVAESGRTIETGPGSSVRTDQNFNIPLNAGWTFIGSPFNFPLPLSGLSLENEGVLDIRSFTGNWNTLTGNLQPFDGYAVFSNTSTTLRMNPAGSGGTGKIAIAMQDGSDEAISGIQIIAEIQNARDSDNWALVIPDARQGWDEFDRPNPPVIGEYVTVYFPRPEWEQTAAHYSTDARPLPSDGDRWSFLVRSNINDIVTLTFNGIETIPAEYAVWLFDESIRIIRNLRETGRYRFTATPEEYPKQLTLFIGTEGYLDEIIEAYELIPDSYSLSQNFPNPFNPATTIRFGLPQDEVVTLTIYDVMGRVVAIPIENQTMHAGNHVITWNAQDRYGLNISSGTYFYHLRAGSYSKTMKLILLR
jgi:hypothetical protein